MRKALIIGIDKYPSAPLRCCVNDAVALGEVLERNDDNSLNFDVQLRTNVMKKADLLGYIKDLFKGHADTALFYFSGHGFVNDITGYLVTPDSARDSEGVSMSDVLTIANNSQIDNKIIILDCCYAGAMGTSQIEATFSAHTKEGITILAASRNNEVAVEMKGHGVFTGLLLEALKGAAADLLGNITPVSAFSFIDQALGPWDQRPVFKANNTRFISLKRSRPRISIDVLRKLTEYFSTSDHIFELTPEYEETSPTAEPDKITVFKHLSKYVKAGLAEPLHEEYLYWAAMKSKSCRLTPVGEYYWRLVNAKRV